MIIIIIIIIIKDLSIIFSLNILRFRPQYETPFVSKPKIPRTPDSRPRTSTPPPLGRSASPPRPTSKDGRPGE